MLVLRCVFKERFWRAVIDKAFQGANFELPQLYVSLNQCTHKYHIIKELYQMQSTIWREQYSKNMKGKIVPWKYFDYMF